MVAGLGLFVAGRSASDEMPAPVQVSRMELSGPGFSLVLNHQGERWLGSDGGGEGDPLKIEIFLKTLDQAVRSARSSHRALIERTSPQYVIRLLGTTSGVSWRRDIEIGDYHPFLKRHYAQIDRATEVLIDERVVHLLEVPLTRTLDGSGSGAHSNDAEYME